jgi:hypothetical protein
MRELRGVIIEETETSGAGTPGAIPVDAARDVLRVFCEVYAACGPDENP